MKIKISKLTICQKLPNIVNKKRDLLMAFVGKGFYLSGLVDAHLYYPRIDTRYLFTPNKEV